MCLKRLLVKVEGKHEEPAGGVQDVPQIGLGVVSVAMVLDVIVGLPPGRVLIRLPLLPGSQR